MVKSFQKLLAMPALSRMAWAGGTLAVVMVSPAVLAATVNVALTAQQMSTTLPDGKTVPMWGYCKTAPASPCSSAWAPGPTIFARPGDDLNIVLTNRLKTPTSIVILGQIGGGVGTPNKVNSPQHAGQSATTWPASGDGAFTPPAQGQRARSFSPEAAASNGTQTYAWTRLKPGTYLYETGSHPSLQAPMGLYGVLVVTNDPVAADALTPGMAYPGAYPNLGGLGGVPYDASAVLLMSEIDPLQNSAVDKAMMAGADEYRLSNDPTCTATAPCYPPAVNYSPQYFLVNGRAFDRTNPAPAAPNIPAAASSKNVLLRLINAGLRSHTPSVAGLGMTLVAEDGNVSPGKPKLQNEVLLTAGKTMDVLVQPPSTVAGFAPASFPVFDRQLSLSNANQPFGGMQGFIQVAGGAAPQAITPKAVADSFTVPVKSNVFGGNVLVNDVAVANPQILTGPSRGTVVLNPDGTFTYTPASGTIRNDSFSYYGNGNKSLSATVTLQVGDGTTQGDAPLARDDAYSANFGLTQGMAIGGNGVLGNDVDPNGYPLTANLAGADTGLSVQLSTDGSFKATASAPGTYRFRYKAVNSQNRASAAAIVTLTFGQANRLKFNVVDANTRKPYTSVPDYRWTIEEDRTFHNPAQLTPTGGGANTNADGIPNALGTNFHASHMPLVATGCVGPVSCGSGQSVGGKPVASKTPLSPDQVVLDPNKYYYISILPADAVIAGTATTGHTMGGALIRPEDLQAAAAGGGKPIDIGLPQTPMKPAQLSIFVFEDDSPTNGDIDGVEENKGLGGFAVTIMDTAGRIGDVAGQTNYDVYNMPLTNALFELDPVNCPRPPKADSGPIGVIYTCPEYAPNDRQHRNRLPLAGHALVRNINPSRYDVWVAPGADRAAAGETWYQVSTLEGTHANDAFAKSGEPGYFQEYGPPGFHAFVGFVNPDHVNKRRDPSTKAADGGVCSTAGTCLSTVKGRITNLHMTRPWQTQLWDSGSNDILSASTCLISLNSQSGTGPSIGLARCDEQGNFEIRNVPDGVYQVAAFDDYLDQIIYYRNITVDSTANGADHVTDMKNFPVLSWFTNLQLHQFIDLNGNGVQDEGEPGIAQSPVTVRYRDGSISNVSVTDSSGDGSINELFPLFNWYVTESDTTRYKGTMVGTVVDGGGAVDTDGPYKGILSSTYPRGTNDPVKSTIETFPGDTYYFGIQGFISQTNIINWGKRPYNAGENGGITGMVLYAATRGLDDPRLHQQLNWEPGIPRVTVRLYEELTAPNGMTSLRFVKETKTSSWDDNLPTNCPGQRSDDPFVGYTLGTSNLTKCFDGMHNWNQIRPAYYDGRYRFTDIPAGRYVVEVVPPAGYEIVKEEDKNVLMGDAWVAPVSQQFAGLGSIFILPDQATVNAAALPGPMMSLPACVGEMHTVPDYLSLFPGMQQVAPFAGESRPLCNRKSVVLNDQMQASADFQLFTETPIAAHYTGMILDDLSSEFNSSAPDFGEKFAVPFVPVSMKDFNGVEINRVYADQWGMYNGLVPSTWEANVPNPSGYAPNMLINCMNDPGPIMVNGKMVTDPNFNPRYSNFCYTNPFMPGGTTYLDTPVLPVSAFAAGYNPPDCSYPDATPAVRRVDSSDGFGPWVNSKGTGMATVTITALGDTPVSNPAYEGPAAKTAPGNQSTIVRHYGFGPMQGNGKVTLGGQALAVTSWSDTQIQVQVPRNANTGELVVTAGNGKSSVDAATLTIDNSKPTRVSAGGSIQAAIEAANPGDLILVDEGTYNELLIMWKPVRLQGVGAPAVIINAAKYPTEKLEKWRPRINDLFGLDQLGNQVKPGQVDPLPGQEITGGIVLLEPSVLSTSEGAGITVLGKNLGTNQCNKARFPQADSNFNCAPSRIDGFSVTGGDSGGGIYVNGWAHGLEIANNRVYGNSGTFTGGIRIGQPDLEDLVQPNRGGFGFDNNIKVHHNAITTNGTVEANAGIAGGGGGLSMCTGSDNYAVNYNFICGNFSLGDGGGVGHIGYSVGSAMANNTIVFNQSFNQNNQVSGGGIVIAGTPSPNGGSDLGVGAVTIDANLIQGNHAGSGHGGGVRLQFIGNNANVLLTNNMIVNNVAGYAGGGIALEQARSARIVNNTVAHNDSTGTAQGAFPPNATTKSAPQPAGIAMDRDSTRATLSNNIVWENRSFSFTDDPASPSGFGLIPKVSACGGSNTGANYWDLGVVGLDQARPTGITPTYSVLTSLAGYGASSLHNSSANPTFLKPYCNVSRFVGPGIFDGTPGPQDPFTMMQAAGTLDEGGNWVEVRYGPLSLTDPNNPGSTALNGDYHINTLGLGIGTKIGEPSHDYDMAARPSNAVVDVGADQLHGTTQVVQSVVTAPALADTGPASGSAATASTALPVAAAAGGSAAR